MVLSLFLYPVQPNLRVPDMRGGVLQSVLLFFNTGTTGNSRVSLVNTCSLSLQQPTEVAPPRTAPRPNRKMVLPATKAGIVSVIRTYSITSEYIRV